MIALNELKDNPKFFEEKYRKMGKNIKLKPILNLAENLSELQKIYEKNKSELCKMSTLMAKCRLENLDTSQATKNLDKLYKKVLCQQRQINKNLKKINKKLGRLPNPASLENAQNLIVQTSNSTITLSDFIEFLTQLMPAKSHNYNSRDYIKSLKNQIFAENDLPCVNFLLDGITILSTKNSNIQIFSNILEFLTSHSLSITCVSIKHLGKSSSEEYLIQINKNELLRLEQKGEFLTRKFKIKYKNSKLDMTNFVSQIDIKFHKKSN